MDTEREEKQITEGKLLWKVMKGLKRETQRNSKEK